MVGILGDYAGLIVAMGTIRAFTITTQEIDHNSERGLFVIGTAVLEETCLQS